MENSSSGADGFVVGNAPAGSVRPGYSSSVAAKKG